MDGFNIKIDAQCIAKYKEWIHVMFLVNGRFNNVLVVRDKKLRRKEA